MGSVNMFDVEQANVYQALVRTEFAFLKSINRFDELVARSILAKIIVKPIDE